MALKAGIVGLPNVGKSTLFNCLSSAKAQAANFPFCTIDAQMGQITVPDERLNKLAELVHPGRIVPATCDIVDIAGLVKGASKGEGLGNQFLGNIRETDVHHPRIALFRQRQHRARGRVGRSRTRQGNHRHGTTAQRLGNHRKPHQTRGKSGQSGR